MSIAKERKLECFISKWCKPKYEIWKKNRKVKLKKSIDQLSEVSAGTEVIISLIKKTVKQNMRCFCLLDHGYFLTGIIINEKNMLFKQLWLSSQYRITKIWNVQRDLVPFVQFKKVKNTHREKLLLVKLQASGCSFTKSNTPP